MELFNAMSISASGMKAQSTRMRVISENIANSETTANTPDADPYRRKTISFKSRLDRASGVEKVAVDKIDRDQSNFRLKYDPTHPAADEKGYIKLPNVNSLIETMDMREANRSYEANMSSIELSRGMLMKTINMLQPQR
ncbi:MAG: flgC [Alphaproteobacteria bacterium]|nr:flgC [Alphaproteobacteria bacterium]